MKFIFTALSPPLFIIPIIFLYMSGPADFVGFGKASVAIEDALASPHVMTALKEKILSPQVFLPVTDVVTRISDDGQGIYREMTMQAPSSGSSNRIVENIYHNSADEVRFCVYGENTEIVNLIHRDASGRRHLQFFKRNTSTLEVVSWTVPMSMAIGAIQKVLERARALADGAPLS